MWPLTAHCSLLAPLHLGGVGVAWSVFGYAALPAAARTSRAGRWGGGGGEGREEGVNSTAAAAVGAPRNKVTAAEGEKDDGWTQLPRWMYLQLAALAWCHVCINWGFFILQSWLPVYLAKDLGFSLGGSGAASALPWFLTAAMAFSSGQVADALLAKGWERWKVRRLMMNIATIGPCVALLLLPAATSAAAAVGLLAAMLGTQAVAIAGYHSYLQDVAPSRAGAFLGITNTLGVAAGIAANVLTGYIVETTVGMHAPTRTHRGCEPEPESNAPAA